MRINRQDYIDHSDTAERVLVVIFLRGGADGLTLVPPVADEVYYASRPTLAVKRTSAIMLDDYFGLHPDLAALMPYFERGEMSIVHGAGSEDETRSHFEAQDFIEHAGVSGGGWLARYLRARGGIPSPLSAVAIGTTLPESLRGAPAGAVIQTIRDFSLGDDDDTHFTHSLSRMWNAEDGQVGRMARDTLEAIRRLRTLRAETDEPMHGAEYPETSFGRGLREIARLIRAEVGLAASTIDLDGWDTHFGQDALIGNLVRQLAGGIDAFLTDLGSLRSRVTVVTMTEFGRRVRENTSLGTDHGLASVMFTLGAGIDGGRVESGWRDVQNQLVGPGDIPVTTNYRDVLAPILAHHNAGLEFERVFPGHDIASAVSRVESTR